MVPSGTLLPTLLGVTQLIKFTLNYISSVFRAIGCSLRAHGCARVRYLIVILTTPVNGASTPPSTPLRIGLLSRLRIYLICFRHKSHGRRSGTAEPCPIYRGRYGGVRLTMTTLCCCSSCLG